MLVAAQYAAKARSMTVVGDQLTALSVRLDEEGAEQVFENLQTLGLVDGEGILIDGSDGITAKLNGAGLGKGGVS
jgi:hypothetical protein